jgi:hypothetical protein
MLSRRQLLTHTATLAALTPLYSLNEMFAAEPKRKWRIGAVIGP